MDIVVVADDLTGAADSGIQLVRAGYTTAVAFRGAPVPPSEGLDATVVDTDSRLLPPQEARERVQEAGQALKDARIVYKKIDSTLRGPIAVEMEAALQVAGRSKAIVAPAFPSNGRSTVRGMQLIHGEPVHETGLANDPHTPVREAHIPSILAEEGFEGIVTLDTQDIEDPDTVRQVLDGAKWIVADAVEDSHLEALVRSVPNPSEILWVGSAGLALALSTVYPGPQAGDVSEVSSRRPHRVLMVVGSTNDIVREQLRWVSREAEVKCVPFDSLAVARGELKELIRNTFDSARKGLGKDHNTVLHTTVEENLDSDGAEHLVAALADVVAKLSEESLFDALVLTGGDTAVHVARSVGARSIMLEEEIEAGVPLGTLIGPNPYPVVTKAGGFGNPETLLKALQTLTGKE